MVNTLKLRVNIKLELLLVAFFLLLINMLSIISPTNVSAVGAGEYCKIDTDCDGCLTCARGVCFPGSCSTCNDPGCGTPSSNCDGFTPHCVFTPSRSCYCSNDGRCLRSDDWWCEPSCPPGYSKSGSPEGATCSSSCSACGNTVYCNDGGGGGGDDGGGGGGGSYCHCNCNKSGMTNPARVNHLISPSNGARTVSEGTTFSWSTISDWGLNIKTCTSGDPGVNCPNGKLGDGGTHRYQIVFFSQKSTSDDYIVHHEVSSTNSWNFPTNWRSFFSDCTTYYWAVRAVNFAPLGGNCAEMTRIGEYSPIRSFRTNCRPRVLDFTPRGQFSGAGGDTNKIKGVDCSPNNPLIYTSVSYTHLTLPTKRIV